MTQSRADDDGVAGGRDNVIDHLARLRGINLLAGFNRWAGLEVTAASDGVVTLTLPWREELGQYSGFLHAGVIGALIDTACGFAAATKVGGVLASHYSVDCLAPARGSLFRVEGEVVRAGRKQVFANAKLFANTEGEERLVAIGSAILVPIDPADRPVPQPQARWASHEVGTSNQGFVDG